MNVLLTITDLFRWLYLRLGVDYEQLRAIVGVKLMMDNRRQVIGYTKNKKEPTNVFVWTLFFYALFGVFIALAIATVPSFMLGMVIFFSYIMAMISMTLITDFSSVLLDTSDNTIILPKPIDGRTLFAARTTHIILYLGQLAIGSAVFPAIVVFWQHGVILFLFFLLALLLAVVTAVILTNGFYLLLMQFASEEKLKNIINYFQIFMAILIMGGYQILPRIMERLDLDNFVFEIQWWNFLLPPIWMAGAMEAVHENLFDINHIVLTSIAVSFPVLGSIVVNNYLSPVFNRKLGAMGSSAEPQSKEKIEKGSFPDRLGSWFTTSPVERGAFDMIYKILGRDRKIKLKIYPAFGYILIFGFIFMLKGKEDISTTLHHLPETHFHILLIYLSFMVLQVTLFEIPYSDDFKASWIYFSAPLESPGEILSGTVKAIFVKLFIPAYLVISMVILYIWKVGAVADLVFGIPNNFLMLTLLASLSRRHLPLSMAPSLRGQAGNFVRTVLTLIATGLLGLVHYALSLKPVLMLIAFPLEIGLIYFVLKSYKKTTWKNITL